MNFTGGALWDWGYEVTRREFKERILLEDVLGERGMIDEHPGKVLIKDRITDAMFQQVLLRPEEYEVSFMPNLNGDSISDPLVAQVGGLGMAPGANVGVWPLSLRLHMVQCQNMQSGM